MTTCAQYRIEIEDSNPETSRLLPKADLKKTYKDYSLAVALAVKSVVDPMQQSVRVIEVHSGEVVFHSGDAVLQA